MNALAALKKDLEDLKPGCPTIGVDTWALRYAIEVCERALAFDAATLTGVDQELALLQASLDELCTERG